MEALDKAILLIAAVGMGSLLVIAGERLIWSKNHLPWGLTWISSSTIYITTPAVIDTVAGISIFSDIDIVHKQITISKTYSIGLISFGFGLGFLLIAAISRYLQKKNPEAATIKQLHVEEGLAEGNYFIFYCGLACIASFALSHMVDGFDRYNSGATSAPIATLLRSLKIESLTLYGFFFGLHGYVVKIMPKLRSIKIFATPYKLPKAQLTAISFELAVIILLVLKTGSRSMLAGCLITTFIAHIVHKRLSPRSIASILLIAVIVGPVLINTFETIRIARSQSDFYKANPIHMAKRLATSAVVWPNMNSFVINNRREEFNDLAFSPSTSCKKFLEESEALLNKSQIERLRRCYSKVLAEYKDSRPFFANGYLSKFVQGIDGKSHASSQDWQSRFREVLGRVPESTSKGESINLSGDLFLRGDLIFTLLGGIFLGCSYCCLSLTMGLLASKVGNETTRSFIYIIPLGLTSGSLFLPIDGQLWLLTTQLTKTVFICFLLGWSGEYFRKYTSRYRQELKD